MPKPVEINSRDINARLLAQVSKVLDDLEDADATVGLKDRITALVAIGRIQIIFNTLRKASTDVESGSAVRRYSKAFATQNAGRGRKGSARSAALAELDAVEDDDSAA